MQRHGGKQNAKLAVSHALLVEGGATVQLLGIAAQPSDGARQLRVVDVPDSVNVLVAQGLDGGREDEVGEIENRRGEPSELEVNDFDLFRDGRLYKGMQS